MKWLTRHTEAIQIAVGLAVCCICIVVVAAIGAAFVHFAIKYW